MRGWEMAAEPTLEELLRDDIMVPVMRSAGLDAAKLRALLTDLARRVPLERLKRPCGCSAERALQPSAV
ncbi:MAG TPA: hypothetical protein VF930_14715 [Stellaceae bacterium]